jgi:predicted O-methyltransferase YrrM
MLWGGLWSGGSGGFDSGNMASTQIESISDIRQSVYDAGEVLRVDGTMLEIVPHTPHPADGDALRDLVAECAPEKTIEIGCATGLSTLAMPRQGWSAITRLWTRTSMGTGAGPRVC